MAREGSGFLYPPLSARVVWLSWPSPVSARTSESAGLPSTLIKEQFHHYKGVPRGQFTLHASRLPPGAALRGAVEQMVGLWNSAYSIALA